MILKLIPTMMKMVVSDFCSHLPRGSSDQICWFYFIQLKVTELLFANVAGVGVIHQLVHLEGVQLVHLLQ